MSKLGLQDAETVSAAPITKLKRDHAYLDLLIWCIIFDHSSALGEFFWQQGGTATSTSFPIISHEPFHAVVEGTPDPDEIAPTTATRVPMASISNGISSPCSGRLVARSVRARQPTLVSLIALSATVVHPHARRITSSTWCPFLSDADWCLQFDVMTDSRLSDSRLQATRPRWRSSPPSCSGRWRRLRR